MDVSFFISSNNLKRDFLFFDQIFIDEEAFNFCLKLAENIKDHSPSTKELFEHLINDIEYLTRSNFLIIEKSTPHFKSILGGANFEFLDFGKLFLSMWNSIIESGDFEEEELREALKKKAPGKIENIILNAISTSKLLKENTFAFVQEMEKLFALQARYNCQLLNSHDMVEYKPIYRVEKLPDLNFSSLQLNQTETDKKNMI